jgi:hypothetical protein
MLSKRGEQEFAQSMRLRYLAQGLKFAAYRQDRSDQAETAFDLSARPHGVGSRKGSERKVHSAYADESSGRPDYRRTEGFTASCHLAAAPQTMPLSGRYF